MTNNRPKNPSVFIYPDDMVLSLYNYLDLYAGVTSANGNHASDIESFELPSAVSGLYGSENDAYFDEFLAKSDMEFDELVMRKFRQEQHLCKFIDPGFGFEQWCSVNGCKCTKPRF